MIHYFIIIVLYGKQLSESSSIRSLLGFGNRLQGRCRLLVWDNSPTACNEEEVISIRQSLYWASSVEYHHNHGENLPLSTLYNRSILQLHEDEMLVLMDDDSQFDENLFITSDTAIQSQPECDLFLPIVHNGNDIVSPAAMTGFKGHYFKHVLPGLMPCRHCTAINSGMIIRARYLLHGFEGYDERIRFYFTDNDFMSRYIASHTHFYVLDYHMQHKLNFYAKGESYETKSLRLKELRHSFLLLMRRRGWLMYASTRLYLFIYSIKFAIIHRDIRYISI